MKIEMETELTEMDSRPDNMAVSEDETFDEAIPIDIIKDQIMEAYKETMSKDINNIDTYETRKSQYNKIEANL